MVENGKQRARKLSSFIAFNLLLLSSTTAARSFCVSLSKFSLCRLHVCAIKVFNYFKLNIVARKTLRSAIQHVSNPGTQSSKRTTIIKNL